MKSALREGALRTYVAPDWRPERGYLKRITCCVWYVSRWETVCLNVPPPDWFLPLLRYVHFFFTPFVAFVNSPKLLDPSSPLDLVLYKATVGRLLKRLRSFPRNRAQQNICFKFWAFIKYSNDTLKIKYKEGVTMLADTDGPIAPLMPDYERYFINTSYTLK